MYSFIGTNPTELYYEALMSLVNEGDEVSPRGKLIKELRPACFEFENPYNRVTFLGSRRINSFFQIAESLWILSGRADVDWLTKFNANMSQFSDNGVSFNAPYGERLRTWGKNAAHNVIINPVDQLADAYIKLLADKDTRQAVMVISNPSFDNAKYTITEKGKDIACNLVVTFKIRHNKLNMTVFNRSNDCHWGTFGANLCQFSTIQETMLSWLKNSGKEEFANLEIGTYSQITDSLHIYLDSYGAKCTTDVLDYYKENSSEEVESDFTCVDEPRMSLNAEQFDTFLATYWQAIDPYIMDDNYISNGDDLKDLLELVRDLYSSGIIDDYWYFGIRSMIVYRLVKLDKITDAVYLLSKLDNCQWKISMMYFLKNFIYKVGKDTERTSEYSTINEMWNDMTKSIVESLVDKQVRSQVEKYLDL